MRDDLTLKKHPIRGAIFGLIAGLGIALLLTSHSVMFLGGLTPLITIVFFLLLGILIGAAGPKRKSKT